MLTQIAEAIRGAVIDKLVTSGEAVDCPDCYGLNMNCSSCGGDGMLFAPEYYEPEDGK